ncbi:MAG: leucine-rich repeat domain-containing protein, partial [Candidatus Cloacimonetes bacterium]|nr:leucine-rich repeat domain-containing protein [Candidatus Cloacimonadota bacterium]
MNQDKTIEWEITTEHIDSQDPLGYKVELSEDELYRRISFVHNTFEAADGFTYETPGGSFASYPKTGLTSPVAGRNVRLPYEPEKLMTFIVSAQDGFLYRVSPDGDRVMESLPIDFSDSNYLAIDESNNDIWITTSEATATIVGVPFEKRNIRYVPVSIDSLAIIPDGFRKSFWEVSENVLKLKKFNGELVSSWNLLFKVDRVLSYQILEKTGNIYITFETSDGTAYSTRYLVFCEFAGNINQINSAGLDRKIGCISKWAYNGVLTGGLGSELTRWEDENEFLFADLSSDGVNSVSAISAKQNDTIYLVNENNYLVSFDSSTLAKQWRLRLAGSQTKNIKAMFDVPKDGRPILFNNDECGGKIRDFSTKGVSTKWLWAEGTGESLSVFGSKYKPAVAYLRISSTSALPPNSSSSSSSSATSISSVSTQSSNSSLSTSSSSSASFSESTLSTNSSSSSSPSSPSSKSSSSVSDEWVVTIVNSSNARIDGYIGIDTDVEIPSYFKNIPVTSTNTNAFLGKNFTSVIIPNSITVLGKGSFMNCESLSSITIPGSISIVPTNCFLGCSNLSNITIEEGVTTLSAQAFGGIDAITSVSFPDSVTLVGGFSLFNDCPNLTEILVSVDNPSFSTEDGILFDKTKTRIYRYPEGKLDTSYEIQSGITIINSDAFYNCIELEEITIPSGVVSIESSAFRGCTSLLGIEIPEGVTGLTYAFYGCVSLSSVSLPSSLTTIGQYCFYRCISLTGIEIPNGVTSIGAYAFHSVPISNLIIPETVTTIGNNAFYGALLTSIYIPESVTSIGSDVFLTCNDLESILVSPSNPNYTDHSGVLYNKSKTILMKYPEGKSGAYIVDSACTTINQYSFYSSGLTDVTLPNGLETIGNYAFQECSSLNSDVYIPASVTSIGTIVFYNCNSLPSITVDPLSISYMDDSGILYNKSQTELIFC